MELNIIRVRILDFRILLQLAAAILLILAGGTYSHGGSDFHSHSHSNLEAQDTAVFQHSHATQELPGQENTYSVHCGADLLTLVRTEHLGFFGLPVIGDILISPILFKDSASLEPPPPKQIS